MENKGLIFIPDISGFTRFMNETEIGHSQLIIQELLEIIINANQIGLEISEIEGDAILFYKFGTPPDMNALFKQVEKMFHDFHRYLLMYDQRRICQCGACKSASSLTLKVISHYGEFAGLTLRNFSRNFLNLHGKDIIVAHQLMKNDIELHEYWLVTDQLRPEAAPAQLPAWVNWKSSLKQTEQGSIPFQYTHLTPLKDEIPPVEAPQLEIANKVKVITVVREFDLDINTMFFNTIDFSQRGNWLVGVKGTDQVSDPLPRVGTTHRCVLDKGFIIQHTSSYSYSPEKIMYSETAGSNKHALYQTYEKIGENRTRLTCDLYLRNNFIIRTLFRLFMKKKYEKMYTQSMENLDTYLNKTHQHDHKHEHDHEHAG